MIEVREEPHDFSEGSLERCCFCRRPTRFWYKENDVACCQRCALKANADEVPSKSEWIRREVIAE